MLKNYIIEQFASMSDEFGRCCARFKDAITITGPDIRFDRREKDRRIIFTLEIPYLFLPHGIMNTMRYSEGWMSLHSR